jgi:hypothetical protein
VLGSVVPAVMRRLVGPALLGLLGMLGMVCSCYVFSDEPKARKQTGATPSQQVGDTASPTPTPTPTPTDVVDCPQTLTGVESQARTIASSCASVRVRGQYVIDGGSLTIAAGVELRFEPGAVLEVGHNRPGVLTVQGTPEQPVRMVADSVSDSGRWQGVRLHAQAGGSSLTQLEIAGAGTSEQAALRIAASEVTIAGLKVRPGSGLALELVGEVAPTMSGVELSGAGLVVRATASAVAALQDTKLEPSAQIAILPGKVATRVEWPPHIYRIDGVVRIEGEAQQAAQLSLTPGTELRFGPDARLVVGGMGPGSLSASGTPAGAETPPVPGELAPPRGGRIRLRAAEGEQPGSWSGVLVQDQGELELRAVELTGGGSRDEGVILAEGNASVALEGCTLRGNLVGVELRGIGVRVETLDALEFANTPVAIRTTPALLGALGSNNRYDEGARIHVERGKIEQSATWAAQAAPIVVHGDVFVDKGATLVVAPGTRIGFDAGVSLGVGYYEQSSLDMRGTAEAPIVLEPSTPAVPPPPDAEPTRWGGIVLGAHAHQARFEHVTLHGTGNPAAIDLRDGADATLVNVECVGCVGAVVRWDCKSSVGNVGVTTSGGTPTGLAAPSNCQ